MINGKRQAVLFAGAVVLALLTSLGPVAAQQPARGYIDARWNSGYVLRSQGHRECGCFVVCPGCSGLVPIQYRSFADLVFPRPADNRVGVPWYLGESTATLACPPVESPAPGLIAPLPPSQSVQ